MDYRVDKSLPLAPRQQLKGAIEFGIAFGELAVGAALPSVREMAALAGVAPMTVTQVYRELKAEGLVEARRGSGTFIADSSRARASQHAEIEALHQKIDAVIDQLLAMGVSNADFAAVFNARLAYRMHSKNKAKILMVGLFPDATNSYADYLCRHLGQAVFVERVTIKELRENSALRVRAGACDFAVTFANRRDEVMALLPATEVVTIRFIPSEATRMALASINPQAKVLVLSQFTDFLPIFRANVQRFAAHVPDVTAINFDDPKAPRFLAECDVVVYATGTEATANQAHEGAHVFEYRHIPDPADIQRVLLPMIADGCRRLTESKGKKHESQ